MSKKESFLAAHAVHEARLGHTTPLIGRFLSGLPLTRDEREIIVAALEKLDGKRGKAELRRIEEILVNLHVEGLMEEENLSKERAVARVMKERDCSRAFVFTAMRKSKKQL